jgi:hypothetical protein
MHTPELLDNVSKTVKDDLMVTIKKGDKLSIAAACFSIYAYQALKKQLDGIDELRFIFTSPTFRAHSKTRTALLPVVLSGVPMRFTPTFPTTGFLIK